MAKGKGSKPSNKEVSHDERTRISSWDDWFMACGDAVEPARRYEDCVREWEAIREPDQLEARKAYARRHDRRFWEQEGMLYPALIKNILIGVAVGAGVGFVCGIAYLFVTSGGFKPAAALPALFLGIPIGFLLGFLPKFLKARRLQKKMAGLEPQLADILRYVPPKYRNSFCLNSFYDIYCSYGIADFQKAIDVIDDHIRNNARIYEPVQILFDVRYSAAASPDGTFVADTEDDEARPEGAPDLSAPGLPSDIEAHIHDGVDDPEAELEKLIGMDNVKKQVRQMRNRVEFFGEATGNSGSNLAFIGPAGSGKTITARIITRILYDFGYIRANRILECDGDYLKSPYVGQTGERVNAIVTAAKGGVLFVDEAYLLYNAKDNTSVGNEAIGVLLKAMEDLRDDLVVILAGYEDGMNRLIASNEGFASRIKYKIYFTDYTAEELGQIFKLFLKEGTQKVKEIQPDAYDALVAFFEVARRQPGFGNARAARNALDRILDIHADRFIEGQIGDVAKFRIVKEDVDMYAEEEAARLAADGRNFMATSHLDEKIISLAELKTRTMDGADDPEAELAAMVGMGAVKEEMAAYLRRAEFFAGNDAIQGGGEANIVIAGPAGVGKSSLVRIITGYLFKAGRLRENRYLDITGDFLKAPYVGQTGKRTEAVIEYSRSMLLFIDEAYLLASNSQGGHDFGAEALGVLVNAMEKNREDVTVVLAGYSDAMENLMEVNSGLRSRIGTTFELPTYSTKELMKIFQRLAYRRGFTCDKGMWPTVGMEIKRRQAKETFGNAREIRQMVDKAINKHVDRYAAQQIPEEMRTVLDANDVI